MDVIGNNIANVNTTAYKSQSMTFSDLLYQTTQSASGANADTGRGGVNARQIGLGSKTAAISTSITTQGSAQSTNNPFDIMISGDSFFIVSDGSQNFFTRDGSFTVDGAGNLVMSSTGYTVMGWQTDENGDIVADTVSALQIMNTENLTYPAESTTAAYISGIVDKTDTQLSSTAGKIMTLNFYDQQGYEYTARFSVHSTGTDGDYRVALDDILGTDPETGKTASLVDIYGLNSIDQIASFGGSGTKDVTEVYTLQDNARYDDQNDKYYITYTPEDMLKGYKTDPLITAATSKKILTTDNTSLTAGTDKVKVQGTVSLDKATLQGDPYYLLYENDKYYYTKDNNGTPTRVELDDTTLNDWKDALGLDSLTNLTIGDAGLVTFEYEKEFDVTQNCTYKDPNKFEVELTTDDEILNAYGIVQDGTYTLDTVTPSGKSAQITRAVDNSGNHLYLDTDTGNFDGIGTQGVSNTAQSLTFQSTATALDGTTIDLTNFTDISIDFSKVFSSNNGGSCTVSATSGDLQGYNTGRKYGDMIGVEVGQDGKIRASYDNGQTKLLGQISVATFANASGLSKQGNNLYSSTMNSGEFDGIGSDITSEGGSMESGVLEMSNVDLSTEFTNMITTQRGFQANSRIITVSDTMLEELVNLKR
jgi:flagellar hook protein FlgE